MTRRSMNGGLDLAARGGTVDTDAARELETASDEAVVRALAEGSQEALATLYRRYAPLIFNLARQSLDRAAAEEIVQDVFLAVWRKAETFDPERGAFRAWVLQIAHFRIINELRRRSRRPQLELDPEGLALASLPDDAPDLDEAAWREYRRSAVRSAMEALPPPQRQALGLAYFEDLTHEQVASLLNLPLGTAKTRIRAGMRKLRSALAPLALALAVAASVATFQGYRAEQAEIERQARALQLVTSSDVTPLRMVAVEGTPAEAHGNYRGRPGSDIAVVTLSLLPPAPAGRTYQVWLRHGDSWRSLGTTGVSEAGSALLIAEGADLASPPDALQVTLEPGGGSPTPTGRVVIRWPGP